MDFELKYCILERNLKINISGSKGWEWSCLVHLQMFGRA